MSLAMDKQRDIYLVIGGNGFLGRHIVQQLRDRSDIVSSFDIVERYNDIPFYPGDISDQSSVASALRQSGATCIIHTASPPFSCNNSALLHRVNVEGTKAVISAAVECGVRKLVYTSSAGVIFNGEDIINVDERVPFPDVPMDAYNDTKAKGERLVLEANGKGGLLTVVLRPAGIFGPGDRHGNIVGMYQAYERGQTHIQIGDNTNLFDWTFVTNVALAHLLAADKLDTPAPAPPLNALETIPETLNDLPPLNKEEMALINYSLLPISLTTDQHRVPTCEARPLGPYLTLPPNGEQIKANFEGVTLTNRPVVRTRFDQFSESALKRSKFQHPEVHPMQVAGQVFFITNGEPAYFWDFPRMVWNEFDNYFPGKRQPRGLIKLSRSIGLAAATVSGWFGKLTGQDVTFTRYKVILTCGAKYHDIGKARRILGYEPVVGLEEGIKRTVQWYYSELQKQQ